MLSRTIKPKKSILWNFVNFPLTEYPRVSVSLPSLCAYPRVSRVSASIREYSGVSASIRESPRTLLRPNRGQKVGPTNSWIAKSEARSLWGHKYEATKIVGPRILRPRHRVRPEVISTEICLLVFVLLSTNIVYITLLHNTAIKLRSVCIYCLSGFSSCTLWQTCAFYLGVVFFHNSEWGF